MKGGRHLLELVDELLEISRIESGEFKVSLRPVDVAAAVEDILHLLQPLAAERHVSIMNSAASGCTWALADEQRVKQVLLNLLSNAIKYNRSGGGVDVSVADPGDRMRVGADHRHRPRHRGGGPRAPLQPVRPARGGADCGRGHRPRAGPLEADGGGDERALGVESMVGVGSTFVARAPARAAAPA